jgi:hypothetical protein
MCRKANCCANFLLLLEIYLLASRENIELMETPPLAHLAARSLALIAKIILAYF